MNEADPTIAAQLARLDVLEAETTILRYVVAQLAMHADPRSRVAIVRALTGAPISVAPESPNQEALRQSARSLLRMIAHSGQAEVKEGR